MTQILQVGDIVRINELTPEIQLLRNTHHYAFDDRIHSFVGQHAIVAGVYDRGSGIISLIQCPSDYRYQFPTTIHPLLATIAETIPHQLTLVCPSPLRTYTVSDTDTPPILGGKQIPLLGDSLEWLSTGPDGDNPQTCHIPVIGVYTIMREILVEVWYESSKTCHTLRIPIDKLKGSPTFTTF